MSALPEPPPSKGKELIAAYRAARLSLRPVLRTTLHQSHVARRAARIGTAAQEPEAAGPPDAPPPQPAAAAAPEAADAASVFASLVNFANAPGEAPAEAPEAPREAPPDQPTEAQAAPEPPAAAYDPPLAEIGFGPGMLIRLSQLGVHGTAALAHAEAPVLRAALGDISRLVDVEAWIASARHAIAVTTETKNKSAA